MSLALNGSYGSVREAAVVEALDTMRGILSNVLKEMVRIRSPWPSHATLSQNERADNS